MRYCSKMTELWRVSFSFPWCSRVHSWDSIAWASSQWPLFADLNQSLCTHCHLRFLFFVFVLFSQLQAPSVKGFDFAKQHLGQHNKDDVLIIHEPAPLPGPIKDTTPSENGDVPSPKSKTFTKPSKTARHRGRSVHRDKTNCSRQQFIKGWWWLYF